MHLELEQEADIIISALERAQCLLSASAVDAIYQELADDLTEQYRDKRPVVIATLNGSLRFASELIARCNFPLQFDSIKAHRYRDRLDSKSQSSKLGGGELQWQALPTLPIIGRHVVLLDEVLDEGHTLAKLKDALNSKDVKSFHTVALVKKNLDVPPIIEADRVGAQLPNRFLVGEGMDVAGYGRNLRGIWALTPEDEKALIE